MDMLDGILKMPRQKLPRPVRPAPTIAAEYRRRLDALIEEMHRSLTYWLAAAYRAHPSVMAADEAPATSLRAAVRRLSRRWQRRFNDAADDLARYFAQAVADRSDLALKRALKRGGFSVEFKLTPAARDVLGATVYENVGLIRSIAQEHLAAVEGMVMRSVAAGRDLESLSKGLQEQFGVTKRRAALIARHQNNLATASIQRVRQIEIGVTDAVWLHSGGGRHPRPSHVKAGRDRVRYSVKEGWWDPDERKHVLPGELINCRCTSIPIVPGFS